MKPQRDPILAMESIAMQQYMAALGGIGAGGGIRINFNLDLNAPPSDGPADDAARQNLPIRKFGDVAVVSIDGVMVRHTDRFSDILGETGTDAVRLALRAAAADAEVGAIVLRIDSPGGSVVGLPELATSIDEASEAKGGRLVSQVDGFAASAGYYAAVHGSRIFAGQNDLVGSIGTLMPMYDLHRMAEQAGVEAIPNSTHELKHTGMPGTEVTKAQRDYLMDVVNHYFAEFKANVLKGRKPHGMTAKRLDDLATGRVWPAPQAMELGLIDGIQTLEETVAMMARESGRISKSRTARARAAVLEHS